MIISFEKRIQDRLDQIERDEGIPPVEFVHQAVEVWSLADADMRRALGVCVMRWVLEKVRR
ncbi:hypothetical protein VSX64_09865 [Aurantimonas sp. C2-6-R+9]|uniref:hypothetical protein n=1 Tax=unclassified Aurantimonas TaxID=2638230 RepID=UPI002E184F34|nr:MULTISPECIES: hypothetical protein [unclassified Aurantimonas]MEC5289959.1 hypothetical protein [Aurantimonas sp. C2-3-R2]MEC5381181.1 hypothetical protein [Aurantimonas sp. C2-6-R+9]MEC5411024.1 hypothetical protein [Aurantimonas sp. C2-4-R8]